MPEAEDHNIVERPVRRALPQRDISCSYHLKMPYAFLAEIDAWGRPRGIARATAIRMLIRAGLDNPPLVAAPPADDPSPPAEALTLTDLAALIREVADTNPFVRPLADLLDGRI